MFDLFLLPFRPVSVQRCCVTMAWQAAVRSVMDMWSSVPDDNHPPRARERITSDLVRLQARDIEAEEGVTITLIDVRHPHESIHASVCVCVCVCVCERVVRHRTTCGTLSPPVPLGGPVQCRVVVLIDPLCRACNAATPRPLESGHVCLLQARHTPWQAP